MHIAYDAVVYDDRRIVQHEELIEKGVERPDKMVKEFKRILVRAFSEHYNSDMNTFECYLFSYMVSAFQIFAFLSFS